MSPEKSMTGNLPLPTPTAKIIPFRRKAEPVANRDQRIREYLRSIYLDCSQPLEIRAKAAILSPWFGERWGYATRKQG